MLPLGDHPTPRPRRLPAAFLAGHAPCHAPWQRGRRELCAAGAPRRGGQRGTEGADPTAGDDGTGEATKTPGILCVFFGF